MRFGFAPEAAFLTFTAHHSLQPFFGLAFLGDISSPV
jgi:hypothetical protein